VIPARWAEASVCPGDVFGPAHSTVAGIEVIRGGVLKKISGCALSVWLEQADGWRFVAFQPTLIP
jgi:hypothetical protein